MKEWFSRRDDSSPLCSPHIAAGVPNATTHLNWTVLGQIALTVLPAMLLLSRGHPVAAGSVFFGTLLLLLAYHLSMRKPVEFASLTIGTLPALLLLRESLFYHSPIAIMGIGLSFWLIVSPGDRLRFWNHGQLRWFALLACLYWLFSFGLTGNYWANLRVLELSFSAITVYLLARHRQSMATACVGIALGLISTAAALWQYGQCLGTGVVGTFQLGHPPTFGLPLALILFLAIADRGRVLLLEYLPWSRVVFGVTAGGLLLLSDSRTAWLVALVGLIVITIAASKDRITLMVVVVLLVLVTPILMRSSKGDCITRRVEQTSSTQRSLNEKTTGRFNQWAIFPRVFHDSPVWGFGPGSGKSVYARYADAAEREGWLLGNRKGISTWHSLYLHVAVEAGAIGILALACLLIPTLLRGLTQAHSSGEVTPLLGILSFMIIGVFVSGMDANSGVFLGLGFLGSRRNS